jgi:putative membrane-bound dehydrogenase-like protein
MSVVHARRIRRGIVVFTAALAALVAGARAPLTTRFLHAQAAPPAPSQPASSGRPIRVLFLGQEQERPHNPARMFPLLAAPFARRGIQLTYVATPQEALTADTLQYYDAVMLYGNHETLTPPQEKALLDFVESGKALVALHSASAEFTNSPKYIALVGAQFLRHGTGEFTAEIVAPTHPVMQGLKPFETWDETYVHTKHNTVGRTVLMQRVDASGREPWTWVRTQGKGRVFYTAYGHDERTWQQAGFQALVERGLVWAVDQNARMGWEQLQMPNVSYSDTYPVPNYENRNPAPQYQVPFSPVDAQKFMQTPAEFKIDLFASEPDIVKPISFNFDEKGRLWVIEAFDYPNDVLPAGTTGHDRIKICEDTNGDGRADKFTIFTDGLNLPTSLVFANGGVIVAAAPNFYFLKDTNGDDKADVKETLFTGWGVRDTHAVASNLQYGPDNFVWGTVGYSGFNGTINGKPFNFTQGAYRFKGDGSGFEYMVQSTNNTWGLGFNETFDVFGSTANGDPSWEMGIPARFFDGVQGLGTPPVNGRGGTPPATLGYQSLAQFTALHPTTPYIRQVDNQGFYTAGAGHMMYTARAFPKSYWNRVAFVNEPTAHLTGSVVVEPKGSGYIARDGWNLVSSAEEWFAPVHAMVGPDGAVWVADFYNFIAQHNPTPRGFTTGRGAAYETPMRDHQRGRIYRISYRGAPAAKKRSLSRTDTTGLLEALASDNMFWRLQAQRLLVERGQKDVVPQLVALVRNKTVDEIGTNGGALHALWTLHGLGELATTSTEAYRAAVEALKHPAAGVRKAAAMVLPKDNASADAIVAANLMADTDLHTRLSAILVLAEMPTSGTIAQAMYKASQVPENFGDPWISRALYVAATKHQDAFLSAYKADRTALPFSALPVPLRIGNARPDWRVPSTADLTAEWKNMQAPGNWEARGLANFDGVVWFTRSVTVPAGQTIDSLSLGQIRNSAEVWVNGLLLAPTIAPAAAPAPPPAPAPAAAPPTTGRGMPAVDISTPPAPTASARVAQVVYPVPKTAMHAGANTVTVRITNSRADGGFVGTPDMMYVQAGQARTTLAGTWKYRVERANNTGAIYSRPGELAAHVAFTAAGGPAGAAGASLPAVATTPDVTLQLSIVPEQLKWATTDLTVNAGQLVEITIVNPDQMPHNFVLGAVGSLEQVGGAADRLSTSPTAAAQNYVPDVSQVVFASKLIPSGQSVTFQFRAPTDAGQYPYMCTYPGHWRLMNGILTVLPAGARGRGGAPAPAGPTPAAPAPATGTGRGGATGAGS